MLVAALVSGGVLALTRTRGAWGSWRTDYITLIPLSVPVSLGLFRSAIVSD
jgi:hypothetical protein